jgi:hypothetical protein
MSRWPTRAGPRWTSCWRRSSWRMPASTPRSSISARTSTSPRRSTSPSFSSRWPSARMTYSAPETDRGPGFVMRLRRLLDRLKISLDVPACPPRCRGRPGSRGDGRLGGGRPAARAEEQRRGRGGAAQQADLPHWQLYEEVVAFLTTLLPADDPGQGSMLIVDGLESWSGSDNSPLRSAPIPGGSNGPPSPMIRRYRGTE